MNFPDHNLQLNLDKSPNSVVITLESTNYAKNRLKLLRWSALVAILYLVALTFINHLSVHGPFLVVLAISVLQCLNLAEKEILKVVRDFGIEKTTLYAFGRKRIVFIPMNNVDKVVLNEVIYYVS